MRQKRVRCDEAKVVALVRDGLTNAQIAETLHITTRTLSRWRAARPSLNAAILAAREEMRVLRPCGTVTAYSRGCRCDACRAAASAAHREANRRAQSQPLPAHVKHGRANTYTWYGCRCRPCTDAHTDYCRPYGRAYQARKRAAS